MPGALKIYKDSVARRKNVPVKMEAVETVVESAIPEGKKSGGLIKQQASGESVKEKEPETKQVETAVYTASPAISPEQITSEQTRRAEVLGERVQGDREKMYRTWAGDSARYV
jgi:hypothetical protein